MLHKDYTKHIKRAIRRNFKFAMALVDNYPPKVNVKQHDLAQQLKNVAID